MLVSDDVVFTEGALAEFLAGPPKGKGADAVARESELEDLADAVTILAKEPAAEPATEAAEAPEPKKARAPRKAAGQGGSSRRWCPRTGREPAAETDSAADAQPMLMREPRPPRTDGVDE